MPVTTRGQLNRLRDQAAFDFSVSIWNTELTVHVNDRTPYTRTGNPSIYSVFLSQIQHTPSILTILCRFS